MKRNLLLFLMNILLIIGCAPVTPALIPNTPTVSFTPEPAFTQIVSKTPTLTPMVMSSFTPTLTSTPQPALSNHTWTPEPILISMRETYGDGGTAIGDLGTTWFMLYADGSLFVNRLTVVNDTYHYQYLTKKLSQQEICQHLNTLDQIGFLDYNASDYTFIGGKPYGIGAGSFLIQISAWKSKNNSYYDLGFYLRQDIIDDLYGQKGYPITSPALRNTYYFLSQYPESGLVVYKPDRLAVWIVPASYLSSDYESTAESWQLKTPSLQKILDRSAIYIEGSEEKYVELKGQDAKAVYSYLGSTNAVHIFSQDMADGAKQYFGIMVRPLLPFEKLTGESMSDIVPPSSAKPNFKLSCSPSDGILPVPTSPSP